MSEKRRKIRVYSPFLPYPVTEGAFQVVLDQLNSLCSLGFDVELVTWKESRSRVEEKLKEPGSGQTLDPRIRVRSLASETKSGEGSNAKETLGTRLSRVAGSWLGDSASPELFFYPPSLGGALQDLEAVDLGIYHYSFAHEWLKPGQPRREKRRVVHFHNFESELAGLRASQKNGWLSDPIRRAHRKNEEKLARHEVALSGLAEELWFVSEADRARYARLVPESRLRTVAPTFSEEMRTARIEKSRWIRSIGVRGLVLGFVGSLDFEPNQESLAWILRNVAPGLLRAGFKGQILVVGKDAPKWLKDLMKPYPFVNYIGFRKSLDDFWAQISFLLSPRVGGSGVQIKLLEALASGVPVLTNREALERIEPRLRVSSGVLECAGGEEWVARILEAPPFVLRDSLSERGAMPSALSGKETYRFLGEALDA